MLDTKMSKAINEQINKELFSGYLYQAMSAYFEDIGLKGFANWMRVQAMEEMAHAKKFYDYLVDRSARVILSAIDAPKSNWPSILAVFEETYAHEQKVTASINSLVDLSTKLSDHATTAMLQWFVTEQVEEEASADEIIQNLKLIGNDKSALFMIDKELALRTFIPPVGIMI